MNKGPKYSEMMMFKHFKFFMFAFCSVLVIFVVSNIKLEKTEEVEPELANAFKVVLDGDSIGVVEDKKTAEDIKESVVDRIQKELGKNLLIDTELLYYTEHIEPDTFTSVEELEMALYDYLMEQTSQFKQEAYIIRIDDFEVAVQSKEEALKVLEEAQNRFDISDKFKIELVSNSLSEDELTPKITRLDKVPRDSQIVASANSDNQDEDQEEFAEGDEEVDETESEEENLGELVEMDFVENVKVSSGYVRADGVSTVDEAVELITKENEEKKIYKVQSGDCLSLIAQRNDMKTSDLLQLNPDIDEETVLQLNQELVVTVPEPELSISAKEQIVYTEKIPRSTEYKDNKDKYSGYTSVISYGSDGVKEVTALVDKVNGYEEGQEVVDEKVIKEPVPKVVERGTKPLPPKGATGNYIRPIVGGRITSSYGYRRSGFHTGVDFGIPIGTTVRASDGGRVTFAGWGGSYGYVIYVNHGDGVQTRYAHLSQINVKVGQNVAQYEKIGETGNTGRSTGPHIHFEILFDGVTANPMKYID
ncbi:MAG: peptidoglycan DD-metalloendopeptidase family protein [Eubacteriales bacterium]